jgi:hypothetical protein
MNGQDVHFHLSIFFQDFFYFSLSLLFIDFQCNAPTWSSRRSILCKLIPSRRDGSRNLAFPYDSGRGQWIHSSILTPDLALSF